MMIVRVQKHERYAVVDKRILEDERLSFKARGIAAYLLSKPDNWQANERHLCTITPEGITSIRSGLKELEDAGYLVRERKNREDGTFFWESTFYESPSQRESEPEATAPCSGFPSMVKPSMVKPSTDKPSTDNQPLMIKDIKSKERKNGSPPLALTGDPYLDAAVRKQNNQDAGRPTYGRQIKPDGWNRELPIEKRKPLAEALASITGKLPLWNAGDEQIHDDLHNGAIAAHRMGYTPDSIASLLDKWRADWRGKNGGSIKHCLEFLSEQKTQAKQAQPKKKVVYKAVEGDM